MTTAAAVEEAVHNAERTLERCWADFNVLRNTRSTPIEMRDSVMRFQPRLARCLYNLDKLYISIAQERNEILRSLKKSAEAEPQDRVVELERFKSLLTQVADIGKLLGDSFVWMFYLNERHLLHKHSEHEIVPHFHYGPGGRGEVEFLAHMPTIGKYLVLSHAISTMLRIGDISLVDLTSGSIVALGELKTKVTRVGDEDVFNTKVVFSGSPSNISTMQAGIPTNRPQKVVEHELPAELNARLQRQIAAARECFISPNPERILQAETVSKPIRYDELNAMLEESQRTGPTGRRIDRGLFAMAIKLAGDCLFTRLTAKSALGADHFEVVKKGATSIVDKSLPDNSLRLGWIGYPSHKRYELLRYAQPLAWWPLSDEVLHDLIFRKIAVMTIYNPAFLIRELREGGLDIQRRGQASFTMTKNFNGRRAEVFGTDYFLALIGSNLIPDAMVRDTILAMDRTAAQLSAEKSVTLNLDWRLPY